MIIELLSSKKKESMPAKKKKAAASKKVKTAATTVKKTTNAFEKAWNKPDKRDGLSFKDTILVLTIALITMGLGYYIGSVVESSRAAELINKIVSQTATAKVCPTSDITITR